MLRSKINLQLPFTRFPTILSTQYDYQANYVRQTVFFLQPITGGLICYFQDLTYLVHEIVDLKMVVFRRVKWNAQLKFRSSEWFNVIVNLNQAITKRVFLLFKMLWLEHSFNWNLVIQCQIFTFRYICLKDHFVL